MRHIVVVEVVLTSHQFSVVRLLRVHLQYLQHMLISAC